jgi:hypothetical protein
MSVEIDTYETTSSALDQHALCISVLRRELLRRRLISCRYIISTCTRRREMSNIPIVAVVEGCRYGVEKLREV